MAVSSLHCGLARVGMKPRGRKDYVAEKLNRERQIL
jgi:hypothetical protein